MRRTPIARLGRRRRARCSRMSASGSAPGISRAPARTCTRRSARECRAVRTAVGLFDASTLGKIEVVGPDAAEFLNRIYTNAWTKLAAGPLPLRPDAARGRLHLSTTASSARLAPDRFHVTTTTGGAPRVLHQMEDYLQTEFPDLKVWLTSTTEQWAVIAVQGPQVARDHRAAGRGHRPVGRGDAAYERCARARSAACRRGCSAVSFTGELGFEINVPADYGRAVWEALCERGPSASASRAYGTEAMHVLRAEKGYIIVGQDTDGTVTPDDARARLGDRQDEARLRRQALAGAPRHARPERKQLVGLATEDPAVVLEEGAQVVAARAAPSPRARSATSLPRTTARTLSARLRSDSSRAGGRASGRGSTWPRAAARSP